MINIIKWVVYSNIWIAFAVVSLIIYGGQNGLFEISYSYIFISFFATLFAYNFQRIQKLNSEILHLSERHIWINSNKKIVKLMTLLSLIITAVLSILYLPLQTILIAVLVSVFVIFYAGNKWVNKSLRKIPYLKSFLIAGVWCFVVILFPSFLENSKVSKDNYFFAILIFLYIYSLCIPFDIRDLKTDKGVVKTIPSLLGVKNSKILSISLLLLIIAFSLYFNWYAFSLVSIVSCIVVYFANEHRKELFYTGLIDGIILLFPLFQIVLENCK